MAGKSPNIKVSIEGEAEFSKARKDVGRELDRISDDADDTVADIKKAFSKLSPELDTSEIKQALALADQLDGMVASFTVDTDISEIQEAEKLAKSLRGFQARVDLSVDGRAELSDALGLAESMDQIRTVKVQVQGRQDLERAEQIARDLDGRKITIPIDARAEDLKSLASDMEQVGAEAGESFMEGFDVTDLGGSITGQLGAVLGKAGPVAALAAPLAMAFGDDFMEGFSAGINSKKNRLLTELQTNFSGADLRPLGEAAGEAWGDGFGEGLREMTVAAGTLETALRGVDDAMDLTQTLKAATLLEEHLGVGIPESSLVASRMIRQGLAKDTVEAYDMMIYAASQYGDVGIEVIEQTKEFGGILARLGVDGPAAIDGLSKAYMNGLFPSIDRGSEMFEEFNLMMLEGSEATRETVENLGLDFDEMQRRIVLGGEPARATIELITQRLLESGDATHMSKEAINLWGMAIESATDRPEAIQWFHDMSKAQMDLTGTTEDAIEKVNGMQTAWDRASRMIMEGGKGVGEVVAYEFNKMYLAGENLIDIFDRSGGATTELEGLTGLLTTKTKAAGDALSKTADDADDMRLEFDDAAQSTKWLETALGGLFDFSADQLFREVTEAGQELVDTFNEAGTASIDMAGNIDISTDAGRRLETSLEGMSSLAKDAAVALAEGRIEAGEYRAILDIAETSIREAGAAAGYTAEQVEILTDKYMDQAAIDAVVTRLVAVDEATRPTRDVDAAYRALPKDKQTDLIAHDKASTPARNAKREIAGLQGKTVTLGTNVGTAISNVKTLQNAINSLKGKTVTASVQAPVGLRAGRASGGPVSAGGAYPVGEKGKEIFIPGEDGTVLDAVTTRKLQRRGVGRQETAAAARREVIEFRSSGSAFDDFLVESMRRAVANRGGLNVVFGGA